MNGAAAARFYTGLPRGFVSPISVVNGIRQRRYESLAANFFRAIMPAAICMVAPIAQARQIRSAVAACAVSSRPMLATEMTAAIAARHVRAALNS